MLYASCVRETVRKVLQRWVKPIRKVLQVGVPRKQTLAGKKFVRGCLKDPQEGLGRERRPQLTPQETLSPGLSSCLWSFPESRGWDVHVK